MNHLLKDSTLKIRLSSQEKKALAAAAKEANMNMSQFILTRTLQGPINTIYYTKSTRDFIMRLDELRSKIRTMDKTQPLDEMLELIDKEIFYLWHLLNIQ